MDQIKDRESDGGGSGKRDGPLEDIDRMEKV